MKNVSLSILALLALSAALSVTNAAPAEDLTGEGRRIEFPATWGVMF